MNVLLVFSVLSIVYLESTAHECCHDRIYMLKLLQSLLSDQLEECEIKHPPKEIEPVVPVSPENCGVRLADSDQFIHGGTVEILHEGSWGSICDDYFTGADAGVACHAMGFSRKRAFFYPFAKFGESTERIWLENIYCNGDEDVMQDCYTESGWGDSGYCGHYEDTGVVCQLDIRLENGANPKEGRVEIKINGEWGTVCNKNFDDDDAAVVCNMMGFSNLGAKAVRDGRFGDGSGPIYFSELECLGDELTVEECPGSPIGDTHCRHGQDVGVICQQVPIRLMDGSNPTEGRVDIFTNGTWGTIFNNFALDVEDAAVLCAMLGFSRDGAITTDDFSGGTGYGKVKNPGCQGDEDSIMQCPHNPKGIWDHYDADLGIYCQTVPVRLVDGADPSEGRVEIYTDGTWGTIDDHEFDENDAGVICGMLGYSRTGAIVDTDVPEGDGDIKISQLKCVGDEYSILQCPHATRFSKHHHHDVGVHCPIDE